MILPRVIGDEPQERSNVTAAAGADTGSAPEAGATGPAIKARPNIERPATDFDEADLRGLLANTNLAPAASATMDAAAQFGARGQVALDCVRTAAGASIPDDAVLVRLIDATFQGTPATIGVFSLPDETGLVVAAARDHCRLLASAVS
jgi:hypothetical protein